jgi:hypothetical protein
MRLPAWGLEAVAEAVLSSRRYGCSVPQLTSCSGGPTSMQEQQTEGTLGVLEVLW